MLRTIAQNIITSMINISRLFIVFPENSIILDTIN